ncbi:filamentous hemagglutinin N-terminal domain-containing protein, partial [Selenomonas ruminantium]
MSKRKHQRLLLAVQAGLLAASIGLYQPAVEAVSNVTHTLPDGGISTTAEFAKPAVDRLEITGHANNNVIAWDSFNVGQYDTVKFTNDKNYLNYVAGTDRSFIDGTISGGGKVYIINPHGVIFGEHAVIQNVGSLYASTRNLTEADFTAFKEGGSLANTATLGGDIVNRANLSDMNITLEGDTITFSHSVLNDTAATVGGGANYTVNSGAEVHVGYSGDTVPASVANLSNGNVGYYKLTNDLSTLSSGRQYMLSGDVTSNSSIAATEIHLDGAGYQITLNGAPLFNSIENSGIYNLNLAGSVSATNAIYTGALANQISSSTITSVTNNASVAGTYTNAINSSDASDGIYIGGIAGFIDEPTKIKNVSNQGDVSSTNGTAYTTYIGGIAGLLTGSPATNSTDSAVISESPRVTSVYNTSEIKENGTATNSYAGGIAGVVEISSVYENSAYIDFVVAIDKSYNTGDVTAKNSGGLIGLSRSNKQHTDTNSKNQMSNSYNTGTISGTTIGLASSDSLIKFTNSYDKVANTYYKEANTAPVTADNITDGGAWRVYNNQPVLTAFLQRLELDDATYTYDGQSHSLFTTYGPTAHLKGYTTIVSATNYTKEPLTQSLLYSDQHGYNLTNTTPKLTIKQADLTFTANEASKTYDGTKDVIGDNTYTHTDLVNGEYISVEPTVAYDSANVNDKSKGEYRTVDFITYATILNNNGEDTTKNYNILYKPNKQSEIKQADLTFTANEASKTYDGTKDVIGDNTYTHTALVNDEYISVDPTVAYDNANVNDKSKGEYRTVDFTKYATILNKQGEDTTQNYNITYKPNEQSEIKQANLTFTANEASKTYDGTKDVIGDNT